MQPQPIAPQSIRFEGTLDTWNDERGFGFIAPAQGGQRIFVHIKSFSQRHAHPLPKQRLTFEVELGPQGRQHACRVELVRVARRRPVPLRGSSAPWGMGTLFAIPAFVVLYLLLGFLWHVPAKVAGFYLICSAITLAVYAMDKAAARRGGPRTPENALHLLALAGGWPGALVAQQFVRHQSIKTSFRATFWATVVINVAGFVVLCSPLAARILSR